jgi:Zn-dependent M16 (insulinase) family peptidase
VSAITVVFSAAFGIDAAFFPLLDRVDFLQEGHRLEAEDASDPQSPLVLKGVVYNEMKVSLVDASALATLPHSSDHTYLGVARESE